MSNSDNDDATPSTLVCSTCGQARPLSDFDARFIGKGTRMNCVACRNAPPRPKHYAWLAAKTDVQRAAALGFASAEALHTWEHGVAQRQHENAARRRAREQLLLRLALAGYTEPELAYTSLVVRAFHRSGRAWADVKRAYLTGAEFRAPLPLGLDAGHIRWMVRLEAEGLCSWDDTLRAPALTGEPQSR